MEGARVEEEAFWQQETRQGAGEWSRPEVKGLGDRGRGDERSCLNTKYPMRISKQF